MPQLVLPTPKDCGIELGPGALYAWSSNAHEQASMEANGYERTDTKSGDYTLLVKGPIGTPKLAKKKATRKKVALKSVPTPIEEPSDDSTA